VVRADRVSCAALRTRSEFPRVYCEFKRQIRRFWLSPQPASWPGTPVLRQNDDSWGLRQNDDLSDGSFRRPKMRLTCKGRSQGAARSTMACQRPPEESSLRKQNLKPGDCTYGGCISCRPCCYLKRSNWNAKGAHAELAEIRRSCSHWLEMFPKNKRDHSANSIFRDGGLTHARMEQYNEYCSGSPLAPAKPHGLNLVNGDQGGKAR
jgi:hypothetical protein